MQQPASTEADAVVDQVGFSAATISDGCMSAASWQRESGHLQCCRVYLQVTAQLQALLAEKARLAQENDRLTRENTGLQVKDPQSTCSAPLTVRGSPATDANLASVAAGAASVHHAATHGTRGRRRAVA